MAYTISKVCETCGGDGIAPLGVGGPGGGDVQCWQCSGTGKTSQFSVEGTDPVIEGIDGKCDDVLDKCTDVLDKCKDIFEKCEEIFKVVSEK
jgi:hypothetical protein